MKPIEFETDSETEIDIFTNKEDNYDLNLAIALSKSTSNITESQILDPEDVQIAVRDRLKFFLQENGYDTNL